MKPHMWNGKQRKPEGVYSSWKKKIQMAVYLIKALLMRICNKLSLDSVPWAEIPLKQLQVRQYFLCQYKNTELSINNAGLPQTRKDLWDLVLQIPLVLWEVNLILSGTVSKQALW